jgi:DNA repair protein RadC
MAKTTTLQRIIAEAKRIQKVHTHMSWKEAIKDASKHIKEGAKTVVKKAATKKATKTASKSLLGAVYTMITNDTPQGTEIHGRLPNSRFHKLALIDNYGIISYEDKDLPEVVKAEIRAIAKEKLPMNGWKKGSTGFIETNEKPYASSSHNFKGYRVPKNSLFGKPGTWTGFEQINGTSKTRGSKKYRTGHEIIIGKVSDKVKLTKVVPEVKVKINRGKRTAADQITSIKDAVDILRRWITKNKIETQEYFIVMYLDRGNKVLGVYLNTIGTMTSVMIDTKLVIATGLQLGAESIIICHNHPSGTLSPSNADLSFTKDFVRASNLLGMRVNDHIIITKDGYYSFAQNGKIK